MDDQQKIKDLQERLKTYEKKLAELGMEAPHGGGRYGNEYVNEQIRVYQSLLQTLRVDLLKLKEKAARNQTSSPSAT